MEVGVAGQRGSLQLGAPRVEPDAIKLEFDAVRFEARVAKTNNPLLTEQDYGEDAMARFRAGDEPHFSGGDKRHAASLASRGNGASAAAKPSSATTPAST